MSIKDTVSRLFGREPSASGDEPEPEASPSHICTSCGEQYDTDPTIEIDTCRSCGGVKVERVDQVEQ